MTKEHILYWLKKLLAPALTVVLGLILVCNPDSATWLIARFLGWVLALGAAGIAAWAMLGLPMKRTSRLFGAAAVLLVGLWMLGNPLVLAKFVGRVLGLTLMIQGARDIHLSIRYNRGVVKLAPGLILAGATAAVGLILLLLPLTTSRIVFTVLGAILIGLGAGEIYDRIKGRPGLDAGDPDIIDVEKL